MKNAKFSELWANGVKPLLDWMLANDERIYATYDAGKNSQAPHNLEFRYESIRDGIKKDFMQQADGLLDRHKISACMYAAIIRRPLLKVVNGIPEKDRFVNAKVAFLASCRVLLAFMLDYAKPDPGFRNFLETKPLCFPRCRHSDSNESYLVQTIKGLCYAQECNELSIVMLANIFCAIEFCTELNYRKDA